MINCNATPPKKKNSNWTSNSSPSTSEELPPTPPHSNSNSNSKPPIRTTPSRNDIFDQSLPQPTFTALSIKSPPHHSAEILTNQPDFETLKTNIRLRINPSPSAILGQGTHGTVYLALSSETPSAIPSKLCAAKLSSDISGSVRETLVLERLRPKPIHQTTEKNHRSRLIIGWLGLKKDDECEWIRTAEETAKQRRKRSSSLSFIPPIVLVLEYCPGGDMFKFVQRALNLRPDDSSEEPHLHVDRRRWLDWSIQIAEALAWCKECHVLVGDLKPQNILLTSQLGIKLSDFNCSTILSPEESQHGTGLIDPQGTGTSVYAAPELVRPPPSVCSYPVDIFSLGITLYYLITGREPYRGVQSAVERMLLISRGAFWEHELAIRWRMLEDGQSVSRPSSKSKPTTPAKHAASTISSDHQQHQSKHLLWNTVTALYGCGLELEPTPPPSEPEPLVSRHDSDEDDPGRVKFYSDGSPKLRHLTSHEYVDEHIIELIAKMCAPLAADRPTIEQVLKELQSI